MDVAFRKAEARDAPVLQELFARVFTDTFGHLYTAEDLAVFLAGNSEEKWLGELSDPAFSTRIVTGRSAAVAYAKLGPPTLPFEPTGHPIELRQFYIVKEWQGAGIAAPLMQWVIDEARRMGAEELYLSVFIDNHRARRFYDRYGFEEVGRYGFKVGSHVDEDLVMRCKL